LERRFRDARLVALPDAHLEVHLGVSPWEPQVVATAYLQWELPVEQNLPAVGQAEVP